MTKILIKKQLMEVFSWVYQNKKNGQNRDKKGIAIYSLLYIFIFGFLMCVFYKMADVLCEPLVNTGFGWLYFSLMGIVGITLGVFGSVFNTFASLYQAKDNDMLFAMPVSVRSIVIARMSGVYAMGLMYELIVMIPAVIVYLTSVKITFAAVCFTVLIPFVLSLFILSLSCVLGWLVALINSRLKRRKILTVIVSIAFIGGYYYICGKASEILQMIVMNPETVATKVKGFAYPLYHMGLASEGNAASMLIFMGIIVLLFIVVYFVLYHSFFKLATTNRGFYGRKYVKKKTKAVSVGHALFKKELTRFLQSTNYMLNCGLGIIFMIFAAVLIIVKQGMIKEILAQLQGYDGIIALVTVASLCMLTSMNDMAAASISLEGKNFWLIQVLPISGWQILKAKINLQVVLNLVPALILTVCAEWVLRPKFIFAVMIPVTLLLFILFMAAFAVTCNLKAPNLDWTSEIIPIKQSLSVMFALFGSWLIVIGLSALYFLLRKNITAEQYLILVNAALLLGDITIFAWLKKKGSIILKNIDS